MKNTIIDQIKELYNEEFNNSTKIHHDPFKGHYPNEAELGKSYFLDKEVENKGRLSVLKENNNVRIYTREYETFIGFETKTTVSLDAKLVVKSVHGCLQLCAQAEDTDILNASTYSATVILTNEGEAGWCLATAFPGLPGVDIGKELADAGYKEGDTVSPWDIPPEWTDHLVVI